MYNEMVVSKTNTKEAPARPKLDIIRPKAKCGVKMKGPVKKERLEQQKKLQEEIDIKNYE